MNEHHCVCLPWSCKLYCREVKSKKKEDENVAFNTAFKNGTFHIPHQFEASFRLFPFIQPQLLPQYKSIKAKWGHIYLPGDRSWEHQGLCDRVRTLKTKTMKPQRLENGRTHNIKLRIQINNGIYNIKEEFINAVNWKCKPKPKN